MGSQRIRRDWAAFTLGHHCSFKQSIITSYCPYFWYSVCSWFRQWELIHAGFFDDFAMFSSLLWGLPCFRPTLSFYFLRPGVTPFFREFAHARRHLPVCDWNLTPHSRSQGHTPSALPGCPSSKLGPWLSLLGCPYTPWVIRPCTGPGSTWFPPSCWDSWLSAWGLLPHRGPLPHTKVSAVLCMA